MQSLFSAIFLCVCFAASACAGTVTVAVASNFAGLAREIATEFEAQSGHSVRIVAGSSGKLFAQIVNGAPYDVFLSADALRPAELEAREFVVPGTRRTYAIGQLVLWSRAPKLASLGCQEFLSMPGDAKIAIANPSLAPYGAAAKQFLESKNLWSQLQSNLVIAENVSQTLQFAQSGGAVIGLVARSQLQNVEHTSCVAPVYPALYKPIEQQLVILIRARDNEAAFGFYAHLQSVDVKEQLRRRGYGTAGERS